VAFGHPMLYTHVCFSMFSEAKQYGAVLVSPGAKTIFSHPVVPLILPTSSFVQEELVSQPKKNAMEQAYRASVKSDLVKQVWNTKVAGCIFKNLR
jgi:hypothetical protein